jgi:hypothetical protein
MEQINTCDVLFSGGGKIKLDVFFPARKAVDELIEHNLPAHHVSKM